MAFIDTSRIAWQYHSDDGEIYRVAAVKGLTDQAKQAGESGVTNSNPKPGRIKMRRVTCKTAAGLSRVFPLYDLEAPLAAEGATITANVDGNGTVFTSQGNPIPENHIRTAPVTTQAA